MTDLFSSGGLAARPGNALTRGLDAQWAAIPPDWQAVTEPFRRSAAGQVLSDFIESRLAAGRTIYPATVFEALRLTPLASVRVVILGQDPYHGPDQAQGLAFSVAHGQRVPPSLRNIHNELQRDLGVAPSVSGDLSDWARHGVLLLNTTLTVEDGQPASHARQGWEVLTDALIAAVHGLSHPVVFMLWGAHAQGKRALLTSPQHTVLMANHPSPLSARRGPVPFIGCGHFSQALAALPGWRAPAGWRPLKASSDEGACQDQR